MNADKLISLLVILKNDLIFSKNDAVVYINKLIEKIEKSKLKNDKKKIFQQIKFGAKIIDYGNFIEQQEKIWDEIWQEANELAMKNYNQKK